MFPMENTLVAWITNEMNRLGLSMREVARRGGITHASISNIVSGNRKPGIDFYVGIAKGLNMPLEIVLRNAGVLPQKPEDEKTLELVHLFEQLDLAQQDLILLTVRGWVERK